MDRDSSTKGPEHQIIGLPCCGFTWFASSIKETWLTHCTLWPASQRQSTKRVVPIQRLCGVTISVSQHFVAANGKAVQFCSSKLIRNEDQKTNFGVFLDVFFQRENCFWCVFFGAVLFSINSPNQSCSKTRYHSSNVDVAVSSATLRPCACSTRSRKQAMWNHNMATQWPGALGLWWSCLCWVHEKRPATNYLTFSCSFINSHCSSTKWFSKFSTKWMCLTLVYDLLLI